MGIPETVRSASACGWERPAFVWILLILINGVVSVTACVLRRESGVFGGKAARCLQFTEGRTMWVSCGTTLVNNRAKRRV